MKKFTDIFIHRPVLATVVSLLILALGLRAVFELPILQYPRTQNAVVTVTTTYYGADADVVAGFITTPLENAIAQADGIDYMTSTSQSGQSTITVNLRLNYDANKALTEINTKVNSVLNQLPEGSQNPVLTVSVGQTIDAMYLGFSSKVLPRNNITDYLVRVVQPRLQAVEGVQTAEILGGQNFALRAWLDPEKLAAYNLTAADVSKALAANDYVAGIGTTKGQMVQMNLKASTDLHSLDEFRRLIVKQQDGAIIRLEDVANVTLGADSYEATVAFDGKTAVYVGIQVTPTANLLSVIKSVKKIFPDIKAQLPQGMTADVIYDSTDFVDSSIHEVVTTLIEAVLIVTVVVFLFLGSPRSVLIPVIAIPLSLIGTFLMMMALGFTINLLTLLALVLAIGLVVDDAIIVVENATRHIDDGIEPFPAAIQAARELANPIIAMTIVLVAVYVPIGFQTGLTGALFTEFAFTLVGAVTISAVVALTLSPMLCSKLMKSHYADRSGWQERITDTLDALFQRLSNKYARVLDRSLDYLFVQMTFAAIILGSIFFLYNSTKTELAPQEDQGIVMGISTSAPTATLQQRGLYLDEIYKKLVAYPETGGVFQINAPGMIFSGMRLKPWDQRERTSNDLQPLVQKDLNDVAGLRTAVFQPSSLPGSGGLPVQFVITTTQPFTNLNQVTQNFMAEARKSGRFMFLDTDLKIDQPQATLDINRDKAAQLGLTMNDIGGALGSMLGGGYVNYFSLYGRSYKVIPQVQQQYRLNSDQLSSYYIRAADGSSVPLSTVAKIKMSTEPETLNHFQQMNAATVSGVAFPGVAMGDALETLKDIAKTALPTGYSVDFGGASRQFVQESSGFVTTFLFALLIIFLALAAQFESFRDPITILISVPMSIAGALFFICLFDSPAMFNAILAKFCSVRIHPASINIYTQVGLVTLIGLVSKHGILITEFANKLMEEGKSKRQAIVEASQIRLRPILMTTAAMVLGVFPLITASGAGAISRFNMGLVIAAGLSIGTLFTLFVHPAVVLLIASEHHADTRKDPPLPPEQEG
jgi:multidrug efflux pump